MHTHGEIVYNLITRLSEQGNSGKGRLPTEVCTRSSGKSKLKARPKANQRQVHWAARPKVPPQPKT